MSDLAERLQAVQTKSESALEDLGEGMSSKKKKKKKKAAAPPPPKPKENIGVGRDLLDETTKIILRGVEERISLLQSTGANPTLLAELQQRKKMILEEAARARR